VQSLIFSRELRKAGRRKWTPSTAKSWAKGHDYKYGKVHQTERELRLRQKAPTPGAQFRSLNFGRGTGIRAIIEFPPSIRKRLLDL
jgi:hypothetical protein